MPPPHEHHDCTTDHNVGSLDDPKRFLDQDYQKLLQKSLSGNELYVDESFPPDSSSIGTPDEETDLDYNKIKWKRPSELVSPDKPFFTVDGMSRFDYQQGTLGNCWFLAAIGALTSIDETKCSMMRDIIKQVIPADQSFSNNYAGIFHFRFWRFGKWVDVVIDDLLPTIDGNLIFVSSKTSNEFWPSLLEKAYAKVCGSYMDLDGGFISEGLMDFTGGVHMEIVLAQAPDDLWNIMDRAAKSQTLMGCSTYHGETREDVSPSGMVGGHAYTVTGVTKVMLKEGNTVNLVRVLNPWGNTEWKGDWSDRSSLWSTVKKRDRKWREKRDDGEFWMSVEDFTRNFETLDICCLCPDFLDRSPGCHWKSQRNFGKWIAGSTAGGSIDNTETFWKNPQFRVRIEELTDGCEHEEGAENILVSLMQNLETRNRNSQDNYRIGFYIFKMKGKSGRLSAKSFKNKTPVEMKSFDSLREVMGFFWLEPGEYLIVPCTENPDETASFVLSIFSKHETHFKHIEEDEVYLP